MDSWYLSSPVYSGAAAILIMLCILLVDFDVLLCTLMDSVVYFSFLVYSLSCTSTDSAIYLSSLLYSAVLSCTAIDSVG